MPRSMWRGSIAFGLVTIPVKLYVATEEKRVSFNMLHAEDNSRISMKIFCAAEEREISRSDTVKGYEIAPGRYVTVTEEDLESIPLATVRAIEVEKFVPASGDGSPSSFVKGAYWVEPDPAGRRPYYLLQGVLAERGLSAVVKVVLREREQLARLDPFGPGLMLATLHWPDEVRSQADLDLPDELPTFKPAELAMANTLVDAMLGEFDPAEYHDSYREALLELIEAKDAGEAIVPQAAAASGPLGDLMAALEASIAQVRETQRTAPVREVASAAAAGDGTRTRAAASRKAAAGADAPAEQQVASKAASGGSGRARASSREDRERPAARKAAPSEPVQMPRRAARDAEEAATTPRRRRKSA